MNTYSFLDENNFRVDVKACSPKAAYNKLMSIPHLARITTKTYIKYNSQGLAGRDDWQTLN